MSKLRIIKERTQNNADTQDLRGLGNSSLLTNTKIEPHLIFTSNDSDDTKQMIQDLASKYDSQIIFQSNTGTDGKSLKVISTDKHVNHKVNCVILFNLSLLLLQKKVTNSIDLDETNWLKKELHGALTHNGVNKSPEYSKSQNTESGMTISPVFSHSLSQAGYNIQSSFENVFLSEHNLKEIVNHLKYSSSVGTRKVRAA